ncbi:MAG: type I glyceraldehyde-3-phosphate dehydrogenase [Thermoleophilia bacterium]|nr:type I glyceraldehyde-3-phosphate dehydrogenase [Thermoleophilia bacterium]
MTTRVAINGFGRIGRCVARRIVEMGDSSIELVAVNDLAPRETMVHLLRYDSVQGVFDADVALTDDGFSINGNNVAYVQHRELTDLPWADLNIDVVIESTGLFTDRDKAALHLAQGAKKVIISAPAKGADYTMVLGVNDDGYDAAIHHVVSNASCTTNTLAPVVKVLDDNWGVESGFMTTCHAYTSDQRLLDSPHSDLRRARAAALNIIPTSTGAAKAIGLVLPHLAGKLDGISLRVPVPAGSVTDFTGVLKSEVSVSDLNGALRDAADGPMRGILRFSEDPLVSQDIVGDTHSSIVDGLTTMAMGRTVKLLAWYDNEWGYSSRVVDLVSRLAAVKVAG